ncbi:MAG TPA: DUF4404 family protein [Verrucomicrobiaceae bacterium]
MTDKLLEQLRAELEQATGLSAEAKAKLLGHVAAMEKLAATGGADKAEAQSGLQRITASVKELEDSHPELTTLIGRIAVALGNMGI